MTPMGVAERKDNAEERLSASTQRSLEQLLAAHPHLDRANVMRQLLEAGG